MGFRIFGKRKGTDGHETLGRSENKGLKYRGWEDKLLTVKVKL